jgi:5'-phosphate synthase pdxT subunit
MASYSLLPLNIHLEESTAGCSARQAIVMTVSPSDQSKPITVGVLALQGAFSEHIQLLESAASSPYLKSLSQSSSLSNPKFTFIEVRTPTELESSDALIIPGGESTTISLVAARSGILEPLRDFVK